jgi:hypothetical protein
LHDALQRRRDKTLQDQNVILIRYRRGRQDRVCIPCRTQ